jgi:hypothetical protein
MSQIVNLAWPLKVQKSTMQVQQGDHHASHQISQSCDRVTRDLSIYWDQQALPLSKRMGYLFWGE